MSPERQRVLDRLRLEQLLAEACLTPRERLEKTEGLRALADRLSPAASSRTDESRELLKRLRRERAGAALP